MEQPKAQVQAGEATVVPKALLKTKKPPQVPQAPQVEAAPTAGRRPKYNSVLDFHEVEAAAKSRKAARRRRRQLIVKFVDVVEKTDGEVGPTVKDGDVYTVPFNTSEGWGGRLHVALHAEGEGPDAPYKVIAQVEKAEGPVELQMITLTDDEEDEAEEGEDEEGEQRTPRRKRRKRKKRRKKRVRSQTPEPLTVLKDRLETSGYEKMLKELILEDEAVTEVDPGDHQWMAFDLLVLYQEHPMASKATAAIRARLEELSIPFVHFTRLGGTLIGVGPVK